MHEDSLSGLRLRREGAVAVVTVKPLHVLHALNVAALGQPAATVRRQNESVPGVIVTGAGEKSLIAAAGVNDLVALTPAQGREHVRAGQVVLDRIEQLKGT
jgi:enoyl-CoA hydratase/carnithine racemase